MQTSAGLGRGIRFWGFATTFMAAGFLLASVAQSVSTTLVPQDRVAERRTEQSPIPPEAAEVQLETRYRVGRNIAVTRHVDYARQSVSTTLDHSCAFLRGRLVYSRTAHGQFDLVKTIAPETLVSFAKTAAIAGQRVQLGETWSMKGAQGPVALRFFDLAGTDENGESCASFHQDQLGAGHALSGFLCAKAGMVMDTEALSDFLSSVRTTRGQAI